MKTLILMRHAKSAWGDAMAGDHQRALNPRGRKAARDVGLWLARMGFVPDEVLVSDATRTCETWSEVAPAFPSAPVYRAIPALYHASAMTLLNVLRDAQGRTVMIIGHNPGIADFASGLATAPPDNPRFHSYPTAATAILRFQTDDWATVGPGQGTVTNFITPHDL